MHCAKPLAAILYIFQGDKGCFLGIGVVLPLLTKLKKQLNQRVFPNLGLFSFSGLVICFLIIPT
jgi:hypothetical protein